MSLGVNLCEGLWDSIASVNNVQLVLLDSLDGSERRRLMGDGGFQDIITHTMFVCLSHVAFLYVQDVRGSIRLLDGLAALRSLFAIHGNRQPGGLVASHHQMKLRSPEERRYYQKSGDPRERDAKVGLQTYLVPEHDPIDELEWD